MPRLSTALRAIVLVVFGVLVLTSAPRPARADGVAVEAAIARITPMVAVIAVETTPPGATVFIDRKDLGSVGTTPSRLGLPAGSYTILVELPGYEPASSARLEVKIGTTTKVSLPLK